MTSRWIGNAPSRCDLCDAPIVDEFYDASMPNIGGSWANVDRRCFTMFNGKLGVGRGQRYHKAQDGSFICVEGGRNTPNIVAIPDGD